MFDTLIWTIMRYGIEIWDWNNLEKMEGTQERFLKWLVGAD